MQVYLVGGAVRDTLLGLSIKDKDFVVIGADKDELLAQGFVQVGADFPVFLHPVTHNEYALARLERKTGVGHTAFCVQSDKTVTLKDDLKRRDLTINALAMPVAGLFDDTITGEVVDYYGGVQDLQNKTLRHVSPAFSEDPLRVLRVARFYARFYALGFEVDKDTKQLMQSIAAQGELMSLSRERLWAESAQAMGETCRFAYWQLLFELDILAAILPNLHKAWQNDKVKACVLDSLSCYQKRGWFALLMASFDNKEDISQVANVLCVPKACLQLANLLFDFKELLLDIPTPKQLIDFITRTKLHQAVAQSMADDLIEVLYCYAKAWQLSYYYPKNTFYQLIRQAAVVYRSVSMADIDKDLKGNEIGQQLYAKRIQKMDELLKEF